MSRGPKALPTEFYFDASYEPEPNSGCWIWTKKLHRAGYGLISVKDSPAGNGWRWRYAHQYSYERYVGLIPDGLELDHKCRMRCCVNPDHLEPVSHLENCRRGDAGKPSGAHLRAKTHCVNGHPFDADNTLLYGPKNYRLCRACGRERTRRARARRRIVQ